MPVFFRNLHPFLVLLILLCFCLAGLLLGSAISLILLAGLFDFSLTGIADALNNPDAHPEARPAVLLYQGIVSVFAFVAAPLLLLSLLPERMSNYLSPNKAVPVVALLLAGLLIIAFMPLNSVVIEWNNHLDLPDAFGFESWAREKEEQLKVLTQYITEFDSVLHLLFGIVVIALIPAIGEELVFRGVVQKQIARWNGNPHVAIWVAAFVFSVIHVQFLGLLPRMLLGALLGYMYFWSGNIWVPIFGHFVNNAFTVLMMYLRQVKVVDMEIESTQAMPFAAVLVSIGLSAALLFLLKKQFGQLPQERYE